MGDLALSNLGGVGALPGLRLAICDGTPRRIVSGKLAHRCFFDCISFFWWQFVPLQVRIIMAVLLGVAVVNNVTVPDWQSFTALTGIQVIMTELASWRCLRVNSNHLVFGSSSCW